MKAYALASILAAVVLLGACTRSQGGGTVSADAPVVPKGSYPLTGEVLATDPAHHTIRVQHDEIKGFMPAMTMDYPAADGDIAAVHAGERIRAYLVPAGKGAYRLEQIWPDDTASTRAVAAAARKLQEDTAKRGAQAYREVGEKAPDFELYDQDGRVVSMARFRGKQVLLNFIYTRCPIADMCPAATVKMMTAQKLARAAGVKNLELVSITLDPGHDTPGVLKAYATARGIDTGNFSFLTGPEPAIRNLLTQFGVIAEFDGGLLKHTLATLLINEDGTIAYRADGSDWEPRDFVAKMHKS